MNSACNPAPSRYVLSAALAALLLLSFPLRSTAEAAPADKPSAAARSGGTDKAGVAVAEHFGTEQQNSDGSVSFGTRKVDYQAVTGTLIVHPKDWDDVPQNAAKDDKGTPAEASMFYVAYFAKAHAGPRPLVFLYNGGPGAGGIWLHMGAFGPRRVLTADDTHTAAAPYRIVNNEYSLLDVADLVFIDAPGTGFSRISGTDREKQFYSADGDAQAFADFITQFLSKFQRWNSPKYLCGESYGTTRSAMLINVLETERFADFNGVILLSQILNFADSPDSPELTPGVDLPYQLVLPSYAATAWYHHKLPAPAGDLPSLLKDVEHFAMNEYAVALGAGNALDPAQRHAIAERLHQYTGLPLDYVERANLRVDGGEFAKTLRADAQLSVGRLDTRFAGPTLDPMSREADYDPQEAAIFSAYTAALNDFLRGELKTNPARSYRPLDEHVFRVFDLRHQPPGVDRPVDRTLNVMPDLALAMKINPQLKVQLNAGYFDLGTPYFAGVYEMQHLPIPAALQPNIELRFYESGHMMYAHEPSLKALHDNVADFIRRTANGHTD